MKAALDPYLIPFEIGFGILFLVCMFWPKKK